MKLKYFVQSGIVAVFATIAGVSCTDTWDEHYSVSPTVAGKTLWENLQEAEDLHPFMRVLDACGYKELLTSQQTYTIWAPQMTDAEADQWIQTYQDEKSRNVRDEENTTVTHLIENHIALFNLQLSSASDGTVKMLNGKRMTLNGDSRFNEEVDMVAPAIPSSNGVIYTVNKPVEFFPNIWERIRQDKEGDNALDSVTAFFRTWEQEYLNEEASVPGPVVDGKVVYLDSVVYKYNELFGILDGSIDSEDSTYWFVAPTNKVWREQLETYRPFFDLHASRGEERDSISELYAKSMIVFSSFFNPNLQKAPFNPANPDSVCSTVYNNWVSMNYPGAGVFYKPMQSNGLLAGLTPDVCSNGLLYKDAEGRIKPEQMVIVHNMSRGDGFISGSKAVPFAPIKVEAETFDNYLTETMKGSEGLMLVTRISSINDKLKVSGDRYLMVRDSRSGRNCQPEITFLVPNTLSNCPYNIKVVFATPLAGDTLANGNALKERKMSAFINYYADTNADDFRFVKRESESLKANFIVDATKMDTVLVAENWNKLKVCNLGEEIRRVKLTLQGEKRMEEGFAVDCVIFEPVLSTNKN